MRNIVKQVIGGKVVIGKYFFAALVTIEPLKKRAASAALSGRLKYVRFVRQSKQFNLKLPVTFL